MSLAKSLSKLTTLSLTSFLDRCRAINGRSKCPIGSTSLLPNPKVSCSKYPLDLPPFRPGGTIKPLYNKLDQSLCFMQRVPQTANYNSFSVLGIVIILVVSGLIIFVSFFIDTLVGSLQRISGKGLHKATQWLLDDKLQLQRMVYEKSDIGPWTNCDAQVPVTTKKMENMGIISSLGRDEHPTYGRGYAEPSAIPSVSEDEMRSLKGGYVSLAQN